MGEGSALCARQVEGAYNRCLDMGITKESEWEDEFWFAAPRGNSTTPTASSKVAKETNV